MSQMPYVRDGEQFCFAGGNPLRNVRVPVKGNATPTITSPTMTLYKKNADVSSTYLTGSMSVAGDIITTKSFTGLVGGDRLFVLIFANVDGVTDAVACWHLNVLKLSGQP